MFRKKIILCCGILLLMLILPGIASAEVWVFFRTDIPLHVDTVNHLKEKTTHELVLCPVDKTTFSFLESQPPECAIALGDAAQQLALSMLWKVKILVTLADKPSTDKRIIFLDTDQPADLQLEMLRELRRDLAVVWYPYVSERFAPNQALKSAATALKIRIDACTLDDPRNLPAGLKALGAADTAIILPPDPGIMNDAIIKAILLASFRTQTPIVGFSEAMVRHGAVFAYVLSPENLAESLNAMLTDMVRDRHSVKPRQNFNRWNLILNTTVLEKFDLSLSEELRRKAIKRY